MIYLHHDLYSNFTDSIKSGDLKMTNSILINELSDLLVYETKQVVDALNKVGITAKEKWSDEELVDAILLNFKSNTKLVSAIAFLIADTNKLINKKEDKAEKSLKIVNDLSSGLSTVSKNLEKDATLSVSMKKDIMEQIVAKANAGGNYKRTIWKSGKSKKRLLFIIGGVVIVGIGAYCYYKYKQSKQIEALALGGMLDNGAMLPNLNQQPPLPTIAPVITPAPTPLPTIAPHVQAQPLNMNQPSFPTI